MEIRGEYRENDQKDLHGILEEIKKRTIAPYKPEGRKVEVDQILKCTRIMESAQKLRERTRASHAAMLFSYDLEPITISEDVGRHNALDKVIGSALIGGKLKDAFVATLSSRISFEMARKAAVAGIRVLVGVSRPTSMAILLGDQLNITIVSLIRNGDLIVYSARERIRF